MRYVVHGLQVISPFALPGISERSDPELPTLELDLFTRASVQGEWEARGGRRIWEGPLGDGETLLAGATPDGRYLFALGDRALFGLDADLRCLACAPSEGGIAWQRILLSRVLANVAMLRGYEALQASAVSSPQGAVLVLAPSATARTALALALALGGWPLISDGILVLGCDDAGVHAHPGTPPLNLDHPLRATPAQREVDRLLGLLDDQPWLAAPVLAEEPRPPAAVCLLERGGRGAPGIEELHPSPLALVPHMLALSGGAERERERLSLCCELAAAASMFRIRAGAADAPGAIAASLRAHLSAIRPVTSTVRL